LASAPEVLKARAKELSTLRPDWKAALLEDAILDLICACTDKSTIASPQDAVKRIEQVLWTYIKKTDAKVASGIVKRLANGLLVDNMSQPLDEVDRLSVLLKKVKITREQKMPMAVFTHKVLEKGASPSLILSLRVPALAPNNDGGVQNLALLIKFVCSITGADQTNVRVIKDPSLGDAVSLPAFQQTLLNQIAIAADSPKGICQGEVYKICEGVNANAVEMLAMLRLLNINQGRVRRQPTQPGQPKPSIVSNQDIKECYNQHCGLKVTNPGYSLQVILEALAYSVRPTNERFPGGFIYAAKERLGVKSTEALLYKLGWIPIGPVHTKAGAVVYTTTRETEGNRIKTADLPEGSDLDFREFRTMVALALPKIDPSSSRPIEEQMRVDPLHIVNESTLKTYSDKRFCTLIENLNLAFAIKTALANPKSKATPEHYSRARSRMLTSSAHVPFVDARGIEYSSHLEIPENIRNFLLKKYHFKSGISKRARSPELAPTMEVDTAVPQGEPSVETSEVATSSGPPVKKSRSDNRQEALRQVAVVREDPRVRAIAGEVLMARSYERTVARRRRGGNSSRGTSSRGKRGRGS
jgi:hypothetical protein